jgi:hypothetical protein
MTRERKINQPVHASPSHVRHSWLHKPNHETKKVLLSTYEEVHVILSGADPNRIPHQWRHHLDYLRRRYGEPDATEASGLAAAASLLASGTLEWRHVEEAIDSGWDPAAQPILDFLGCAANGSSYGKGGLKSESIECLPLRKYSYT